MRNINTGSRREYLLYNLIFSTAGFVAFRLLIFCPIVGQSYKASIYILIIYILVSDVIGILLTYEKRRNRISAIVNAVGGGILYFLCSFWVVTPIAIMVTLCVAAVAVLLYGILVIVNYREAVRNGANPPSPAKWLPSAMLNVRTVVSMVFLALIVVVALKPVFGFPIKESPATEATEASSAFTSTKGEAIANNIDAILLLQDQYWTELNVDERMAVLRTIADIEANHLGIPPVNICAESLAERDLGSYTEKTRTVTINLGYLVTEPARVIVMALCHEMFHCYEKRLVAVYDTLSEEDKRLLIFLPAAVYKEEFANYIQPDDDFEGYQSQLCEEGSNDYAEFAYLDYYFSISHYNNQHGIE